MDIMHSLILQNRVGYDPYEECNQMLFRLVNHFNLKEYWRSIQVMGLVLNIS